MGTRLEFHEVLVGILGTRNVYFQPPPSFTMVYPCIVYNRNNIRTNFANNKAYIKHNRYLVTVIDSDPDSVLPDKIAEQPLTTFERQFTTDGLYHNVFNTYY